MGGNDENDPMSPSASPNRLQTKWGVRRANDLPLYLLDREGHRRQQCSHVRQ